MNAINLSTAGHTVLALPPGIANGVVNTLAVDFRYAEHLSLYLLFGQQTGSPPPVPWSIVVSQSVDANLSNTQPLSSFRYYYQTSPVDVLDGDFQKLQNATGPPNYTTSTSGITTFLSPLSNTVYLIEIDSAELDSATCFVGSHIEFPYVFATINTPAPLVVSSLMVFTGLRQAYNIGQSFTV